MRNALVSLALLVTATAPVEADPHVLEGGALIIHHIIHQVRYTPICDLFYEISPISDCNDQNNTVQTSTYVSVVWFVVAAFDEDKEWCQVQFGLSDFDPDLMGFADALPCYPPGGGFELESSGWPGPGEGTTIVATGGPWQGNWVPVYGFWGYAYGGSYAAPGVVQLIPDPTATVPFGGFRDCADPPEQWDAALGGLGLNQPGTWGGWGWEYAVCCLGDDCIVVQSEGQCADMGGEFHPEWDNCDPPNPCVGTPTATSNWGSIKALYR